MSLESTIEYVQTQMATLPAIKSAPVDPPESAFHYPFAVCYPPQGRVYGTTDWLKAIHTLFLEVHVERFALDLAVATALPILASVINLVTNDPTLGGNVSTIIFDAESPITYQFGEMVWNGVSTIGFRISLNVKIQGATL